ncbi:MAG: PAS domain-containing sensor histidine kinase [Melioribacteraceae bacterium]|nr:PAS domain-containing sensor histidine kinase [Melioribacteraceae bacterium]
MGITERTLLVKPLRILAYLTIFSGLIALIFEVRYFTEVSLHVYWARYVAIAAAFWVLLFSMNPSVTKYVVALIHTLLLSIIISFGIIISILPSTVLVNSSIAALTIFTAALFLNWDVKNQIIVAIYYNLVFAAALFLNRADIYFQPNLFETVILVSLMSSISVAACMVNNKLREDILTKTKQVKESERRFKQIFDTSREGIFQLSRSFDLIIANDAFKKIVSIDNRSDVRKYNFLSDFILEERDKKTLMNYVNSGIEVTNMSLKLRVTTKPTIVNLNLMASYDAENKIQFYQGSIHDITTAEEIKENLIKAKERAERANELKTEFLAQVSHEIRTPIHVLLAFSNLIREQLEEKVGVEDPDAFHIIETAGRRIIRTINMILNMSELQTGTYEYEIKKFDIYKDILPLIIAEFEEEAKAAGLKVEVKVDTDDTSLIADQYGVEQIIANLLSNAIKFTNQGNIDIIFKRDNQNKLFVEVRDTGIGISKEYFEKIFDPFTQENQGYARPFEGNGLGLAIVKKFCEMNKANIDFESEKGRGSSFRVTFNS